MDDDYLMKLVVTRLQSMPPNSSFSIGRFGDFTKEQLIREVMGGSNVGKAAIEMELNFLREMPKLSRKLSL
ncbi:hypothetical protein HY995_01495 [Candidatus Micrarchaeota archaeon]|nr:hypothetical protein [Candidatus Micrarchaeota archaeon]MBI5176741.1 hypothetical protein [Candidatus Micrarchaeota archaeon]